MLETWHPIRWRDIPRSSKLTVEKSSSDVKKMEKDVVFHCCCVVNDLFSLLPCASPGGLGLLWIYLVEIPS